ncbi:MAG TPA: outer-membrane lipoprotein carrier protein LolA [Hyphomicrobiaceae bacterium]|nr:outer-membrane lipoprotein carrier protein LolA [Hyphomicrobiaceae bacterium]
MRANFRSAGLIGGAWSGRAALALGSFLAIAIAQTAVAQAKKDPPPNPVGAGWQSKVKPTENVVGATFDAQQAAVIQKVNTYFNGLAHLQGRFVQTDADKVVTKGKFYIKRPGRFRFEYSRPSRKAVVSDGRFLAIQDLDLGNEDTYELDNTPFRILLRKDVDLLRDAKILAISETPQVVSLTLADKSPDAPGTITINLTAGAVVELAGWVTADAQGLETRVEVSDIARPDQLDDKLFQRAKLFIKGVHTK